jgi:hypothetical protein
LTCACRYKADLSTRDSRLSELQEKWFKTQLQGSPAATGPTGHVPAAPLTAEQRDMQQALQWFRKLGWDVHEPEGDASSGLVHHRVARVLHINKWNNEPRVVCSH